MSYILDALRRAESERGRKRGVPGLHAQPVMANAPEDNERPRPPWLWIAMGLSIGLLLMVAWRWWSAPPLIDEAALARAPVGGNVTPGAADTQPAAPPAASAAPPAPPAPAAPAPAAEPAIPSNSAAPATPPSPAPRTNRPNPPPRSTAAAAANAAQGLGPNAATSRAPPSAAAPQTGPAQGAQPRSGVPIEPPRTGAPVEPPPPLPTLAQLPDDLRSSVPQLAFGGSVYSDTPAQRMVIFNGQVLREGDTITGELQVEQIRPRSAVLRVRGQHFEMPF